MKKITLYLFITGIAIQTLQAQNTSLGSWNILNANYNLNDVWSIWGEGQIRSLDFYKNFHYYEYKGGINYQLHKNAKLTLGAGSYQTYKEGGNFLLPKNNDEFRLWPQISLSQSIGKFKLEQRFRQELRYTSNGYRNRFRYRTGVAFPFGQVRNEYQPFQFSVSNEFFFTDKAPYFERNRFLVALNYKPSKVTTLQIGVLHQFDYKITDEIGRDFLVIGLYYEIFRKANSTRFQETEIRDN